MLDVSRVNYLVTALATPSGKGKELVVNKIRGIAFGMEAIKVSGRITKKLKAISKRPRRDNENAANSFPSGHTSNAATIASLAARNIERISLTEPQEKAWRYSSYSVAALTGWARVEARRHYPSDILAGYALGNFLGNFLNDAFITPKNRDRVNLSLNLDKENGSTLMLVYHW